MGIIIFLLVAIFLMNIYLLVDAIKQEMEIVKLKEDLITCRRLIELEKKYILGE